jgi:3-deoxy-manno-octulosonate cytidylyltransferase (CMP-KDO synthetase)
MFESPCSAESQASSMSVAIILPARLASTRLPNKLLLDRSGKTILEHTIDRAKEAQAGSKGLISRILVAADDEKLIAAAQRAGVDAVMTDPNHPSGTDRIAEAVEKAGLSQEVIVNLQSDEPELNPEYVLTVVQMLGAREEDLHSNAQGDVPMATLATFITDEATFNNPNVVKVVWALHSCRALYFSRAPIPFPRDGAAAPKFNFKVKKYSAVLGFHHIGIYAYKRDFLLKFVKLKALCTTLETVEKLEQLRALEFGYPIRVALVESNQPGIDTPEDYEAFLKRCSSSKSQEPGAKS